MQALKNGQQELQARLNTTQNDEREARRNLSTAGEEIAAMREKHRDEVDELERKLGKKERERKEMEEDCKELRSDLESCKGEVRDLKVSEMGPYIELRSAPLRSVNIRPGRLVSAGYFTAYRTGRIGRLESYQRTSTTGNSKSYFGSKTG